MAEEAESAALAPEHAVDSDVPSTANVEASIPSQGSDAKCGSGAFLCEVLDARPQAPLEPQFLVQGTAWRRRSRSRSAGSRGSEEAAAELPSPWPAPPSPAWVEAAASGGFAAALAGVAAELRAMGELEEAQRLLQQMPEPEAAAEDNHQNLAGICRERLPRWLADFERLERRINKDCRETKDAERQGHPEEVLRISRQAGAAFGRAIQQVVEGTPIGTATMEGALTLEEELAEFARDAAEGRCGLGALLAPGRQPGLSAGEATQAAADLFCSFGDVQGYAAYLERVVHIAGADVPLSGGAAWRRLMEELEVAMRLVHLQPEHLQGLDGLALQLQGAHVLGGQGWEDMAQKLMHLVALGPLQCRARYAVARVAWTLRRQKVPAAAWLRTMGKGSAGWGYASAPQHWQLLESNPQVRELVFGAIDAAAAGAAEPFLAFLEAAICSGCQSPQLLLRPCTKSELGLFAPGPSQSGQSEGGKGASQGTGTRSRVRAEVLQRFAAAPQLPAGGPGADDRLRALVGRSFRVLRATLVSHVLTFAGTALAAFTNRGLDEAIGALGFHPRERRVLESGHRKLEAASMRAKERLEAAQRCSRALRYVRTMGF